MKISRIIFCLTGLFGVAVFQNCRGDYNPPEINGSYPLQNAVGVDNNSRVWIEFSEDMDRSLTETAFSLFTDSDRPRGQFIWEGNKMVYIPRGPMITGKSYTMLMSKTAEDSSGNNLRDDFQINFTVNPDSVKPYVVSTTPVYGQTGVLPTAVLTITFSKPVDQATLIPGITVTPSVIGTFSQNAGGDVVTFTPQSNLLNGTVYTININTNIKDTVGNPLLQAQTVSFVVGTDFVRPTITSALNGVVLLTDGITSNLVSRNNSVVITFSELMSNPTVISAISISPTSGFSKVFSGSQVTLTFSPPLESETLYTLSVNSSATDIANNILNQTYNYKFFTDAPDSVRPKVVGIRQAVRAINSGICTSNLAACPTLFATVCPGAGVCDHQGTPVSPINTDELVGVTPAAYPAAPLTYPAAPGTVRQTNETIEITEEIDVDPVALSMKMRIILNVYFTNPMNVNSLLSATTITPFISGPGNPSIGEIVMDSTKTMARIQIIGWKAGGNYLLKIAGGTGSGSGIARDLNNNTLLSDFIIYTN